MNSLFLIIIGIPTLEIIVLIKIGQLLGAINTIMLVFFTAIVGIYFAKIEGLNTIKSGVKNIYQNKAPVYEMLSGASIAIASGEEKTVPKIISNYEFIWRLRTETYRRIKRLLETYIHFKKKIIFTKLFKKVSFRIYK